MAQAIPQEHETREPLDAPPVEAPASGGVFRSLRHRNYRLLFIGTLVASGGLWLQQATINYLAFTLSGSSLVVGLANGARSLPLLGLAPVGGVMADRYDKKRLMLSTQVALMALTFAFAVIIVSGYLQVWHIIVFSLFSGVAWALNMPVRQSVIPTTVPRADMMNAMALNSAGFNITRILGPSLAGIMIVTVGAGENFLIQSVGYLVVAFLIMQLVLPEVTNTARSSGNVWQNMKEGAAFVWQSGTLRVQMMLALVPVLIALPYVAILPQFNAEELHGDAVTFGVLMAAPGLGAVAATMLVASMKTDVRYGLLLLGSLLALGVSMIVLAFATQLWMALGMLVLVGGAQMVYMTASQTVVQLSIPDEYRGRVMGIYMLNQGMLPLGSVFAGTLADLYSASTALMIMGALVACLSIAFALRVSSLRQLRA